jgi:hypothetical protein
MNCLGRDDRDIYLQATTGEAEGKNAIHYGGQFVHYLGDLGRSYFAD